MKISKTLFPEVLLIEPKIFEDDRGFFYESYRHDILEEHGVIFNGIQDNHSSNKYKNTLRGIHSQLGSSAQAKIVRCTQGSILDVVVDLRIDSPNYGKYLKFILSSTNNLQIYIPRGFGHAYLTLEDNSSVLYKADNYYDKSSEVTIIWNDLSLAIDWDIDETPIISDKDKLGINLEYYCKLVSDK